MKITCDREQLMAAFQIVATVAPSRSPKAILQNVKMTTDGNITTLLATDTEVGIRMEVGDIAVASPGTIVVPVSRFGMILRESTDEKLTIESDGTTVQVHGQRSEFKLAAENPDEFPEIATFDETKYHVVSARVIKELIRRTLFATDNESSRYALGGVLLVFEESHIIAVGTDSRRLAKMEGPAQSINGHRSADQMTIVPARAMQLIERALSDADAEIKIAARANDILLKTERATIYARLVEGRYPRWQDVVADRPEAVEIDILVGPFYSALRQASVVASEETRGVDFSFGNGTLVVSGLTAEVGQSRVELPIPYEGEQIVVSLDHRFVGDFLRVLPPEMKATLRVQDNEHPADFVTEDGYHYVVMPMAREKKRSN